MKHTPLSVLVLIALLLSSGTALAQKGAEPGGPPSDFSIAAIPPMTVRIAVPIEDGVVDPIDPAFWSASPVVTNQLFSGLTRIDPDTSAPVSDLALSWTHNSNSSVFTFTLRGGLKWSNGAAITANDVRNTIIRTLDPATRSDWAYMLYNIQNAAEFNTGSATESEVGVTVLSPTQVRFTLTGPAAYFPSVLATPGARVVPTSVIDTWETAWTEPAHIVTSGPYRLTEWVPGERFLLDQNAGFYDAANVKILHISALELDEWDAWALFLAGGLDTVQVPVSELGWVKADPTLGPLLHGVSNAFTHYFGFSTSQAPFDDPLVRKAFAAAINRQGLIDAVLDGTQTPAQTFTAPGVFGHVDGAAAGVGIPYSVIDAQTYLNDSTYPGGVGLPPITFWYNPGRLPQEVAEYMQQNWADNLGVTVTLNGSLDWPAYLTQLDTGTMQAWALRWAPDYYDAYNFLNDAIISVFPGRFGDWSTTSYTNLLNQAVASPDTATRLDLYKQAEEVLTETDAVLIPLYYNWTPVVTRGYLDRDYAIDTNIRGWAINTMTSTVTSIANEDGWLLESGETSNVGGTMNASGTAFFLGDNAADKQYRAVLSFDTSALPNNAVITAVALKIKGAGVVGTNPFSTHGNILADVRYGSFAGNSALEIRDFQVAASKTATITIKNTPVSGWYSGSMLAGHLGYINKAGLTQFRLRFTKDDNDDLSADYLKFYSGNAPDPASYPKLIIKYYAP